MSMDYFFALNNDDIDRNFNIRRYEVAEYGDINQSEYNNSTTSISNTSNECDISNVGSIENIGYFGFMVIILLASIIGNSLVVMASVFSKQLRHRVTVYFIVSLAISDLLFAVTLIPFNISMKVNSRFCHDITACYVMVASDALCNVASILNLFLIAIDRFIAITMPFRYSYMLTVKRAKRLIAGVWTFSILWSIIGLFKWGYEATSIHPDSILSVELNNLCLNKNYNYYAASYFGIYLPPLLIMSVTYLIILQVALVQIQAIESTHVELQEQSSTSTLDNISVDEMRQRQMTNDIERHKKAQQRKRRKEVRATKSVAIVYFAFLLCWLPSCVINVIITFDNSYFPELRSENETLFLFIYYCFIQILPMVNTMVNPIIYSFSNKQFRAGFRSVYNRFLTKLESPDTSYESSRRDTRVAAHPMSPTSISSSSQSSQSVNSSRFRFRWSPMPIRKISDECNVTGTFQNKSIDVESARQSKCSNTMIWKPD